MKITKRSAISGKVHTLDIPLTEEEFKKQHAAWQSGTLIQHAFPTLNADQREFIKTGITAEEWDALFNKAGPH